MGTEDDILMFYRDLNILLTRRLKDYYCNYNLTMPQVRILGALDKHGPMIMSELARHTNSTNSTISGVIDRLEQAGMVERVRETGDRRRITVRCTEKFESLKMHAITDMQQLFHELFGHATQDDRECILSGLQRMRMLLASSEVSN